MPCMDEFELPDGRKVRFTDRALDNLEDLDDHDDHDDHDDCAFCLGRAAAHRGEDVDTNPFGDVPRGSVRWYDTDYGMWLSGHEVGSTEPGGLLWFEQPNRGTDIEQ
ncbi:MAG: hypothetical protein K0U78_20835 [Actinomycetia bacterium]|nr:hypothetical protein [Actinomycetes bacterium]